MRTATGAGLGIAALALGTAGLVRQVEAGESEAAQRLPGDDLVEDPAFVTDSALTLSSSAADVWPWLLQLGKARGGWYLPRWLEESVIPPKGRGLRTIDPALTDLAPGDRVPDWGQGDPEFEVVTVDPPHALVYRSERARKDESDPLVLSWALVLTDLGAGHPRLHIRLRINRLGRRFPGLFGTVGRTFDQLTVWLLFAGLSERMAEQAARTTAT